MHWRVGAKRHSASPVRSRSIENRFAAAATRDEFPTFNQVTCRTGVPSSAGAPIWRLHDGPRQATLEMIRKRFRFDRLAFVASCVIWGLTAHTSLEAASPEAPADAATRAKLKPFLNRHCADCHNDTTQEGELNLAALKFDVASRDRWITIFDRAKSGEMPPKDEARPDSKLLAAFLGTLSKSLDDSYDAEHKKLGRVRSRRLTRAEYENTMHDLLGIDIPLQEVLPEDTYSHGFANVAKAQQVSHYLLKDYLNAADAALDAAFAGVLSRPYRFSHTYTSRELGRRSGQRDPWHVGDETIAWSTNQVYHGRVPETRIRKTGWYRITLHDVRAVNARAGTGVWCTIRSGVCFARAPLMYDIGVFRASNRKRDHTFDAWIRRGHMIEARPADRTIRRVFGGRKLNNYKGSRRDRRPMPTVPGLAYSSITIKSISRAPSRDRVHKLLFGDLRLKSGENGPEVISAAPQKDAAKLMAAFASRAFRRPVSKKELAPYLTLVERDLDRGVDFAKALKGGYRALLCSPRFLFFYESPGKLDDHAIATRLSYFLWSTMPDAKLRAAADAGRLSSPKIRHQQVERMLNDPRSKRLVKALADQWLNLREIDFTSPDPRLYREFDLTLKQSMIGETHAFLAKLIKDDLSTSNIIHSDFAMLNERLAKHYKIPGVTHQHIRPVTLKPESHRGGIITQGAILKVTANGTTTSPVVRGAWINERILGVTVPPPPDNVPAIEPDIRGAKTIREQLKKHRANTSCAACHLKIDPPGFALENYDVIGGWRTKYRSLNRRAPQLPVDPHYKLPNGASFDGIGQFKQIILKNPDRIARNFTHQLVTYSTGAPVTFGDRNDVEDILQGTRSRKYGVRSLIHAVIDSPIFLRK